MDYFKINGGKSLSGEVTISGAKNSALPCLFATVLTDEPCHFTNVPALVDINTTIQLLEILGKKVRKNNDRIIVEKNKPLHHKAPYELVRKMRASMVILGPLLARMGKAEVSLPGGCAIGARPINYHIKALKNLGAKFTVKKGYIKAESKNLHGRKIKLPFPSVGATENQKYHNF